MVYPVRYMVLSSPAEGDAADAAVMVSVPKRRHKRANVRNLLKRRMREAYRLHKEPLRIRCTEQGESVSLGLMYISQDVLDYSQIENAVRKIISRLSQRS